MNLFKTDSSLADPAALLCHWSLAMRSLQTRRIYSFVIVNHSPPVSGTDGCSPGPPCGHSRKLPKADRDDPSSPTDAVREADRNSFVE
jgi:hypothetical protein